MEVLQKVARMERMVRADGGAWCGGAFAICGGARKKMAEQGSWWRHCCSRGGAAAEMTARRLCARRDAGVGAVEMAMVVACRCRIVVAGNGGGCRGG